MTDYPVITISRQYASGGRKVAKNLSNKLGLPWYDHDLVKDVSLQLGISEEEIKASGESLSRFDKFLDSIMKNDLSYKTAYETIYNTQKQVILELAKTPCIIVGRCSNIILKEQGIKSFDVFLYADEKNRRIRAEEVNNGRKDIEKFIKCHDAMRENYYSYFTKHKLGDFHDYSLMIDTGKVGIEGAVDIIIRALKDLK